MGERAHARSHGERGAAAVEFALVAGVLLVPLLLGVVKYGEYFWHAQRVDTIAPAIGTGQIAGDFDCQSLKDEVVASVLGLVQSLDDSLDIDAEDITVVVAERLPDVGVVVDVHVEAGLSGGLADLIPLPGGGALTTDFSQRLDDVRVTDAVCR